MSQIVVGGRTVPAGERARIAIPVTRDLAGPVDLQAHVVAGAEDGPTLLILAVLHGSEWPSVLVVRDLLAAVSVEQLAGVVIAVPVANPPALLTGTRCILDGFDEPDMNRVFGGTADCLSNQLARAIERHLLPHANALIDFHTGDFAQALANVSFVTDHSDRILSEQSRAMALAAGFPVVLEQTLFSGVRGPRTSVGLAGERFRIPSLTIEVGGAGFDAAQEAQWRTRNIDSALAVMRHLRMIPGEPAHLDRYLYIRDYWRVTPRCGGYLEVLVGLDRQLTDVGPGDLLGRVLDPATFEVLEELRPPGRGVLFHACRSSMVRPGAWGFGVARFEGAKAQWYSYRRGDVGPWRVDPGRLA